MATRPLTTTSPARGVFHWSWDTLTETNADGAPVTIDTAAVTAGDKTVHVFGTFGSGGNVVIQGSNDGTNWFTLNDPLGTALGTITANAVHTVLESPAYIRPFISAGTGVDVDVIMVGRAIMQLR